MLTEQELIHYSRHIILPQIDEAGQKKIKESKVLVIGMGGLGAPVAMYLAAAGVGHLYIADHDQVERSNLQRQIIHKLESIGLDKVDSAKATLKALNPWIEITSIPEKLEGQALDKQVSQVDLVVDCCDNFSTRFAVNRAAVKHHKPLISGAAIRFEGQLGVFNYHHSSPCYQCLYQPDIQLDENCFDQGVLSPVVGTIGSLQATETLKVITGAGNVADGKLLVYDALNLDFRKLKVTKDENCPVCSAKL
ncbi:HesA/MoeB/ThiF family protein [Kangiella shandongensis]|uniref:HesA/MoeB/ThiF family protein n=1 Tax=Kangiella shandongensis TaxID=2763258 RepID=UPI001CBCEA0E|nr:molybdopterin-synthase adenylyltransferase MoeB [Kangiella shandongensis]